MNAHDPAQASSGGEMDGGSGEGVERLLASFAPRPSRLDRDRLMFLAGRAAAERSVVEPVVAELSDAASSVPASGVAQHAAVAASASATVETASVARTPWYWPAATAVSTLVAAALAGVLFASSSFLHNRDAATVAAPSRSSAPQSPANDESPVRADAPSNPSVAASNSPSTEVAKADDPPSSADDDAASFVWPIRAAVARGELDEPSSLPSNAGDADPPSTYLRAVRSVINRPQSLSLELRY